MIAINLTAINVFDLPEGCSAHRLAGDWIDPSGIRNNDNRPRHLEVVRVWPGHYVEQYGYVASGRDGGGARAWVVNSAGYLHDGGDVRPVTLDASGAIPASGGGWTFLPDDGEISRIGLDTSPIIADSAEA